MKSVTKKNLWFEDGGVAFVRIKDGKPQVKFPEDKEFSNLTAQFETKSVEEIIPILEKLPANKGIKFEQTQPLKAIKQTAKAKR